jgi:transcriptional regulator with XRE-family HTH domain
MARIGRDKVKLAPYDLSRDVAARLRTLRRRRGYGTALDAAKALGMRPQTYAAYERGDRTMKLTVLGRILGSWDATLLELMGLPPGEPNRPGGYRPKG